MALLHTVLALHPSEHCIPWPGAIASNGYGLAWDPTAKKLRPAHRAVYEHVVGPIPDGLQLDHLAERGCTRRDCVNAAHLEPVTALVNHRRSARAVSTVNASKTHCPRNHPYDEVNTYVDGRGRRSCRACRRVGARSA